MKLNLQEAAQMANGQSSGEALFHSVTSDTRQLQPGCLFVALRGERFDGHGFVCEALQRGAAAALVERQWVAQAGADVAGLPLIIVDDTRAGLTALATAWRARFSLPVIGVTGSNGKTTVKEMCAAILRAAWPAEADKESVLATQGNLNNDIGVPLTLLRLRDHHRAAVIEMGMNHPGEIAALASVARPTVALVNNAQRAHLMGLGGLVEIAEEKGAIYSQLPPDGVAIINADDHHAEYWRAINRERTVLSFASHALADVRGECEMHGLCAHVKIHFHGATQTVALRVPGMHNASNALAAAAASLASGVTLAQVAAGLESFAGAPGRLQLRAGAHGATLLDDTYNANPDSVRAGIDVLASTPGRKVLVLGDMGEIGESSAQLHDEVGGYAKSKGVDVLMALGDMSAVAVRNFGEGGSHYKSPEALAAALLKQLDADTYVLIKGSRFMRMERVVELLAVAVPPKSSNGASHHAA